MTSDLDPRRAASQIPSLLRILDERDPETDELAEHLQAMNLSVDTPMDLRILRPTQHMKYKEGAARQRVRDQLGGDLADRLLPAMADAIQDGELRRVRQDFRDTTAEAMNEHRLASEFHRQAVEDEAGELESLQITESPGRAELAVRTRRARLELERRFQDSDPSM